jgi:hypothetical protein
MAARRKKQEWKIGDVFHISLLDGDVVLAQIVGREAKALNSITIALFDIKCKPSDVATASTFLDVARVFAVLFVTRDLLDNGEWPIFDSKSVLVPETLRPYEDLRQSGFVGARIIGSGIVEKFVNAFYGLRPWDAWHDPNFLDGLLLSLEKKPVARLVYKPL